MSSCAKTECGVTCNLVQVTETVDCELLGHDEIEITNSDCQLRVKCSSVLGRYLEEHDHGEG
jgi:hypothetical protein